MADLRAGLWPVEAELPSVCCVGCDSRFRLPFASAVLGVAAYRFFMLFGPLPASLGALPKLRALTLQHAR